MNECNVTRDLMPLCIDGVASEDSRKLVKAHVEKCEKCAAIYADYQKEFPTKTPSMSADEAVEALRKWRRMRRALLIGLTTMITVAVLFAGVYVWDVLTVRPLVTLPLEEYEVSLVRMQDGQVGMIILTEESGLSFQLSGHGTGGDMEYEVRTSVIRQHNQRYLIIWEGSWQDGVFWADDDPGVGEVRQSITFTDGESVRVVYTAGDEIPPASAELEALNELSRSFYSGGKGNGLTDEQQAAYDAQYALVPEFNPD